MHENTEFSETMQILILYKNLLKYRYLKWFAICSKNNSLSVPVSLVIVTWPLTCSPLQYYLSCSSSFSIIQLDKHYNGNKKHKDTA